MSEAEEGTRLVCLQSLPVLKREFWTQQDKSVLLHTLICISQLNKWNTLLLGVLNTWMSPERFEKEWQHYKLVKAFL